MQPEKWTDTIDTINCTHWLFTSMIHFISRYNKNTTKVCYITYCQEEELSRECGINKESTDK